MVFSFNTGLSHVFSGYFLSILYFLILLLMVGVFYFTVLIAYRTTTDFCILTFYLANLLNSLIGSSRFFVVSCLIAMARTSSTMNRSRDIIFLFLSEEESIQPFTIKYNVRCTFFINALNLSG